MYWSPIRLKIPSYVPFVLCADVLVSTSSGDGSASQMLEQHNNVSYVPDALHISLYIPLHENIFRAYKRPAELPLEPVSGHPEWLSLGGVVIGAVARAKAHGSILYWCVVR